MTTIFDTALRDKHVAIVGGSSGLGKATAKLAVALGARVTIASRNETKLKTAATEIGSNVAIAPIDTTNEQAVKAWAAKLGPVDHLVISASSVAHGEFASLPTADLHSMFEAKFAGPYMTAREVLPFLNSGASITFFSGVLSRRASVGTSGLSAVNAAIEALSKALAMELAGKARVNCISPGLIATEAYADIPEDARNTMYEHVGNSLPVGRVGHAEEIAQGVILCMTNDFMTGTVLDIDGGHLANA